MRNKSLSQTNPYLSNKSKCKEAIITNVRSSSAIEGIYVSKKMASKKTVAVKSHSRSKPLKIK